MNRRKENTANDVFKAGGDTRRNVQVHWLRNETPYAMTEAFKEAGDYIVEKALASPMHPDRYFYPILFLYRHYLELQLKNLIALGHRLLGTAPTEQHKKALSKHFLDSLWEQAKELIAKTWPDEDSSQLTPIEEAITAFHEIDRTGEASRYHKDKGGNVLLADAPTHISLEHLRGVMDRVYRSLSGCECAFREYLAQKAEMTTYLADNCDPSAT
jgi:hypothetical protein